MIKPKLHHVTIKTSRLDEMIAWYGQVIGAQVQFRDQVAAWTTNDDRQSPHCLSRRARFVGRCAKSKP